ncbi:MAG: hypothetical protein AAF449_10105 [Myxococcota bacterium]
MKSSVWLAMSVVERDRGMNRTKAVTATDNPPTTKSIQVGIAKKLYRIRAATFMLEKI